MRWWGACHQDPNHKSVHSFSAKFLRRNWSEKNKSELTWLSKECLKIQQAIREMFFLGFLSQHRRSRSSKSRLFFTNTKVYRTNLQGLTTALFFPSQKVQLKFKGAVGNIYPKPRILKWRKCLCSFQCLLVLRSFMVNIPNLGESGRETTISGGQPVIWLRSISYKKLLSPAKKYFKHAHWVPLAVSPS